MAPHIRKRLQFHVFFAPVSHLDRNSYAPKEICDAIYSGVSGALYDPTIGYWRVPCATEIDMALQIGLVVL